MSKLKKENNSKSGVKHKLTKRRPTPWEQKEIELNNVLELMSKDIQILYDNIGNIMTYMTIIANINTVIARILISKKITTEAAIKKQYLKLVKEMEQKDKEIKEQMKKFTQSSYTTDIDFSDTDIKNMKVN